MYNLFRGQGFFYFLDKIGAGQCALLTGSVIIPRRIPFAELQEAANGLLRINDQLRLRFVEKDGKIYQEIKPFERKEFEVMHFESREALHEWGEGCGTIYVNGAPRSGTASFIGAPYTPIPANGAHPDDVANLKNCALDVSNYARGAVSAALRLGLLDCSHS